MIEGTFYTEETDVFYNRIQEGETYLISKAEISVANKKFTTIKHDYRLIFKLDSVFQMVTQSQRPSIVQGVSGPRKLNFTEIEDINGGDDLFIVVVYGTVSSCVTRDSINVQHADWTFKGRHQLTVTDLQGRASIQVNMWGFDGDDNVDIDQNDMVLIIDGRVTHKYGAPQINVNPKDGKVIVNPSPKDFILPG